MNKHRKWASLLALLCTALMSLQLHAYNKLIIPDVMIGQGSSINLPVNLENDDPVVALQFTLTVPNGFTVNASSSTLTERKADHAVRVKKMQGNDYLCLVYSPANMPLRGNRGTVFTISIKASSLLEVGSTHPLIITDAVASDETTENVLTESSAGSITVGEGVDLVPTNIKTYAASYRPGDHLILSWDVENQGQVPTSGGWSEQISLIGDNGAVCSLQTAYYNDVLSAGATVSRQIDITLPRVPSIHGYVAPQVRVVPNSNCGERPEAQGNNTATGARKQLEAVLYLDLSRSFVEEAKAKPFNAVITRSGDRSESLTVTLHSDDSRLSVPATATIEEGQSSVNVTVTLTDNSIIDENANATITASAQGYPEATSSLVIEDNEHPQLTIETSQREITEGESVELTVNIPKAAAEVTTVAIACNAPGRFAAVPAVVIAAGSTSGTVTVTSVDDENPALDQEVTFVASCIGYDSDEAWVTLHDNDMPTMDLSITPTMVSESSGPNAIMAKLRRLDHTNTTITVKLSDDSQGDLTYPQTITMPENATEVQFSIGTRDNQIVDGDRVINLTAAIYIKSCSCQAQGGSAGSVTKQITVTDNDGPAITLRSNRSTIAEGSEATLTITRNANMGRALTVNLSSDNDSGLEYAHQVTIPAGKRSVDVVLQALLNDVANDDRVLTLTAQADGYSSGSCWVMISNQTLPDAVISAISLSDDEVVAGSDIEVSVTVSNTGSYELPSQTKVTVYLSNGTQLTNMYSQAALAPGGSSTLYKTVTLPAIVGSFNIYAVVNEGNKVNELITGNNKSDEVPITLISPFSNVSLTTDKTIYQPGDSIVFNGSVSGNVAAGTPVEVYYICNGLRRTIATSTNASGHFSAVFHPFAEDMGHFIAGACSPGENSSEAQTAFDIVGLKRATSSQITCDLILNEHYSTGIGIVNPSSVTLHNVRANILSQPDTYTLTFANIAEMEGGSTATIDVDIVASSVSPKQEWEQVQLELISDEGARTTVTLFLYCRLGMAKLEADVTSINTTMTKGQTRNYPIHITNTGRGNSGKITLSLPNWMNTITPQEMPGLMQGDTALIVLTFTPTEDMQLNVPRTGRIGINCENGSGMFLNFRIVPVSEETGTLTIDVCDEYTYNTVEAPHVQGAHVIIKHPTTGELITEGYTGENGKFSVTLPEGYYALRVSADKHQSYANNILVDPGVETLKILNLSFSAITTNWSVVETEIDDEYEIVTTYTYETNVPRPVVIVSGPTRVNGEDMAVGESQLLYFTLTNKGLIGTNDVVLELPESNGEWSMTALAYNEPFALAAQDSVVIPVMLTRLANEPMTFRNSTSDQAKFNDCSVVLVSRYHWPCGEDMKEDDSRYMFAIEVCPRDSVVHDCTTSGGSGGSSSLPSGSGGYYDSSDYGSIDIDLSKFCTPLFTKCLTGIITTALSFAIPGAGVVLTAVSIISDIATEGEPDPKDLADVALKAGEKVAGNMGKVCNIAGKASTALGVASTAVTCIKAFIEAHNNNNMLTMTSTGYDWLDDFCAKTEDAQKQLNHFVAILDEITGDPAWYNYDDDETLVPFWERVSTLDKSDFTYENLIQYKPESVSEEQLNLLIERFNNSYAGSSALNRINTDSLQYHCDECSRYDQMAQSQGFETMADMFNASYNVVIANLEKDKNSVCTSVTMQLSQHLVMTRQAFRGTLSVYNGHDSEPIRDAKLTLVVADEEGNLATSHEFEIVTETLNGFQGALNMNSGWTLDAGETGTATILFIPTKYAAPTEDKVYLFGGSFSYIDPFTGLLVTRELYPDRLTVRPSPNLVLDYFMQRDIYGDDPFTVEVEPMQNAEFALIIDNQGNGDAKNVTMTTHQPTIIENEKGLLIDFSIVSSQLNGEDATLVMDDEIATDFGTIVAHSQAYAQWWLQSSLLGHFTSYNVSYNHLTSYGNEDLSLIDTVRIHELIHGFTTDDVTGKRLRGFLTNDLPDANDTPDMIHFTNGTQEPVAMSSAMINRINTTQYMLTVNSSAPGWNYGSVIIPIMDRQKIISVVRQSDDETIYADNAWKTDRTLVDGLDWLYESRLHYVMDMSGLSETYVITFSTVSDDVDGNGKVDIADVTELIDIILKGGAYSDVADINNDGRVNIIDITELIDILFNSKNP